MEKCSLTVAVLCVYMYCWCWCDGFPCGFQSRCTCKQQNERELIMDCSDTNLNLSQICKHAGNTTVLQAGSNAIKTIENTSFVGCSQLQELNLSYNAISDIDNYAFRNMSVLLVLDLSHNQLDAVYRQDKDDIVNRLEALPYLETLMINGNLQAARPDSAVYPDLSGFHSLKALHLDGLENKDIGLCFQHLKSLYKLVLTGFKGTCNLGYLQTSTFQNLTGLEYLDISNCNITNIEAGCLEQLPSLEHLDMSSNVQLGFSVLRNVSYGLQSTNIKFLDYSKMFPLFGLMNQITKYDLCYLRNTTLREIAFDTNKLGLIESNALMLLPETIQTISVRYNWLQVSPYVLQVVCLSNLTTLHIDGQYQSISPLLYFSEPHDTPYLNDPLVDDCPFLKDLKNKTIYPPPCQFLTHVKKTDLLHTLIPDTLTHLSMTDSSMRYEIPETPPMLLSENNSAETIEVSGNILYSLQGPVTNLKRLNELDVSKNYCNDISRHFFSTMANLESLNLGQNYLGNILATDNEGKIFENLSQLRILNLSFNSISSLPDDIFRGLRSLEVLHIGTNDLAEWTANIHDIPYLRILDLSSNQIQSLPKPVMDHFEQTVNFSIDLSGNRITCACDNAEFLRWLILHRHNFIKYTEYIFIDKNANKILNEKDFETAVFYLSKECASYTLLIVLSSMILTLSLSLMLGGLIYKHRWKLRYFLYISYINRFYRHRHISDDDPFENYRYDAFVSYAEENIRFILDGIIPKLEASGLSLCIHQRDFLAGNAISANILDAIQSSRWTIVVLSKAFVKSKWCVYEFNMARMESIYSRNGRGVLLVVMLENVEMKHVPHEMAQWLRAESYLEYPQDETDQPPFWETLKTSMQR